MQGKEDTLNGSNFSKIADFIYAEVFRDSDEKLVYVKYPLNINILQDNDVIYCKTDYIYDLFHELENVKKDIKIITSQSDYEINENIFKKKPKCIKKWFAINVNYEHRDLIPIPLGTGTSFPKEHLLFDEIEDTNKEKENLLYINHRSETNFAERGKIYEKFRNNPWCTIDEPTLQLEQFKEKVKRHNYVLCPRGNGFDTHRMWECLYIGTIPVVRKHITHKNLDDLPILFVENYEDINENLLLTSYETLISKKREKLKLSWWNKYIRNF